MQRENREREETNTIQWISERNHVKAAAADLNTSAKKERNKPNKQDKKGVSKKVKF